MLSSILSAVRLAGLDASKTRTFRRMTPSTRRCRPLGVPGRASASLSATWRPRRLISAGTELYLSQGGTTATCTVSTLWARLSQVGVTYASPSGAAQTALNNGRDEAARVLSSNGWTAWRNGSHMGPLLDALREQLMADRG